MKIHPPGASDHRRRGRRHRLGASTAVDQITSETRAIAAFTGVLIILRRSFIVIRALGLVDGPSHQSLPPRRSIPSAPLIIDEEAEDTDWPLRTRWREELEPTNIAQVTTPLPEPLSLLSEVSSRYEPLTSGKIKKPIIARVSQVTSYMPLLSVGWWIHTFPGLPSVKR
jgi:hypothetical protein